MSVVLRWFCIGLLGMSIAACTSHPVNAPVGTRGTQASVKPAPVLRQPARPTPGYYTVRRGDTLYSIAWQHGLSYRELAALNGIGSPYTIFAGQQLRVRPVTAKAPAPVTATPESRPLARPSPSPTPPPTPQSVPQPALPVQAAEQPLPAVVSKWVWPAQGKVLRGFQADSPGKKGVDIGGRHGQPVVAAAEGRVVYSGSGLVGYGRLIIIKHSDSLLSAYGHNSRLLVKEGERVKAGQVIARMGSSGTDGTRLYFEIRKDGKPVDPLRYLPKG
jgi:lipoprotein NlpD